jgi:chromosomal replication initiation ATPase DnaA
VRQIAMYVCHVTLQMTLTAIGDGFGRDRSTVAHACAVVEDRRYDKDFDEFVAAIERIATLAFGRLGGSADA